MTAGWSQHVQHILDRSSCYQTFLTALRHETADPTVALIIDEKNDGTKQLFTSSKQLQSKLKIKE